MNLNCQYCGLRVIHTGICPRIQAIEYHPDGTIKRVEFVQVPPVTIGGYTGVLPQA